MYLYTKYKLGVWVKFFHLKGYEKNPLEAVLREEEHM